MMKPMVVVLALLASACSPQGEAEKSAQPKVAAHAAQQPKGRYAPRNECNSLPGADDFHEHLVEAVQLRDANALAALADPKIKLDFGGGGGIEELKRKLSAVTPGHDLWKSLEQLLRLGCAKGQGSEIVMPWLFSQELDSSVDPAAAMLVMGEDVPILPEPRASAKPIGTISWDVIHLSAFDPAKPFQPVSMPLHAEGWMATDKLRSLLDYRLLASREGGQWKITALVAGD
jgi:hypothetical protein